ncbi:MAG: MATE family efflux transporter [Limibacillus sp.]|jgi:MATE family multidrug resistance protein
MSSDGLVPSLHHSLGYNIRRTLELAAPVTLSRALTMTMIAADTVMSGWAGPVPLANYGLAFAIHMPIFVIGLGIMVGVPILVSQADGAMAPERCGPVWRKGLQIALLLGAVSLAISMLGERFFLLIGHDPALAKGAGDTFFWFAVGLPGLFLYIVSAFFVEGLSKPRVAMTVVLFANFLNIAGNWLLIEGNLGFPAMGAEGAALSLSVTRWCMAAALIGYILFLLPDRERYALKPGRGDPRNASLSKLLRLGIPFGTAIGLESLAFATLANFAGRLGTEPLAGYQAAMNMTAFIFMIALGFSAASTVRVGNAVGREDAKGVRLAGWTGLGLVLTAMTLIGFLVWRFDGQLARFYNADPAVISIIVASLSIVAVSVLFDGAQAAMMGALRGAGDVLIPSISHLFSFWVVGVPLCWYLGLHLGQGVPGLFLGMVAALLSASLLLALRFAVISRRAVRPIGT